MAIIWFDFPRHDRLAMPRTTWFRWNGSRRTDSKATICKAKPIVVVHESGRSMTVGRLDCAESRSAGASMRFLSICRATGATGGK